MREYVALGVLLVILAAVEVGGTGAAAALRYDRAGLAQGELWRVWTAHLVHASPRHLVMNAAALMCLWALSVRDAPIRYWLAVIFTAAGAVAVGLWFIDPEISWYVGLSGVLHGIWAADAVRVWRRERGFAMLMLSLLTAKIIAEQTSGPLTRSLGVDIPVVVDAHAFGALGGLAVALSIGNRLR